MNVSEKLGVDPQNSEQYGFFYRPSKVTPKDDYQWTNARVKYVRPPYIMRFSAPNYVKEDFAIIPLHAKPDPTGPATQNEIDGLVDVYDHIRTMWSLDNMILFGDFNADCVFLNSGAWIEMRLSTDRRFQWILRANDYTAVQTRRTYDRIVLVGDALKQAYQMAGQDGEAMTYHFDPLTTQRPKDISDHYPVQFGVSKKRPREEDEMIDRLIKRLFPNLHQ